MRQSYILYDLENMKLTLKILNKIYNIKKNKKN